MYKRQVAVTQWKSDPFKEGPIHCRPVGSIPSYPTVMVPEWSKGRDAWLKRALGLTVSTQDTSESMVAHD